MPINTNERAQIMIYKALFLSLMCGVVCQTYANESMHKTRYGQFQIKESDDYPSGALYFNHKLVSPVIEGNNSLDVKGIYKLKSDDVLLVEEVGGSGCPITLYFVKIAPTKKVSVSPAFGSCSDLIKVNLTTNQIVVTMPDFIGSPESEAQERAVAKRKMTYIYDGHVVKENGKVLKQDH